MHFFGDCVKVDHLKRIGGLFCMFQVWFRPTPEASVRGHKVTNCELAIHLAIDWRLAADLKVRVIVDDWRIHLHFRV